MQCQHSTEPIFLCGCKHGEQYVTVAENEGGSQNGVQRLVKTAVVAVACVVRGEGLEFPVAVLFQLEKADHTRILVLHDGVAVRPSVPDRIKSSMTLKPAEVPEAWRQQQQINRLADMIRTERDARVSATSYSSRCRLHRALTCRPCGQQSNYHSPRPPAPLHRRQH